MTDAPNAPDSSSRDDLPDPGLFWRWAAAATRPIAGWLLMGLGAVFLLVGYLGTSREALVAKQLPYLVSGGIGGVALLAIGAFFLGTEDLRRQLARLNRLEDLVEDLHSVLLEAAPADSGDDETSDAPDAEASHANGRPRSARNRTRTRSPLSS